jgi:hypothetical protein
VYYFYSIGNSNVHKRKRIIAEMSMKFRSIGATRLTVPKLVLYERPGSRMSNIIASSRLTKKSMKPPESASPRSTTTVKSSNTQREWPQHGIQV